MLKGTRIRVTRDCIDKSTGEVWIKRGSTGTLKKIFNNVENFPYEVLLDDVKRGDKFDKYDAYIVKRFGADYAKEFIAAKAKVV